MPIPDLAMPVPVVGCSRCRELELENAELKGKLADWMEACRMASETIESFRRAMNDMEAETLNREARRRTTREKRRSAGVPADGRVVRLGDWPKVDGVTE
jgi:hypothetical protein